MQESGTLLRRLAAFSLVFFLGLTLSEPCLGQTGDSDQAIQLAYEARAQFEAGHFREALQLFVRAREKARAPTLDLYIARCHKALGEWRSALASYSLSVNAPQDPNNVAWSTAQQNAALELGELEQKLPRLTLSAPHLRAGARPTVSIDDEELSWPVVAHALDPGKHFIVARHDGQEYSRELFVAAGEHPTLELPLREPSPPLPVAPPTPVVVEARDEAPPKSSLAPWIWGSAVLAGVGATAGSVTGILAFTTAGEVRQWCQEAPNGCPNNTSGSSEIQAKSDLSRALGDASTVSFIAAGAFAAAAVTLWILDVRAAEAERPKGHARIKLQPYLDLGLSVQAAF